MNIDKYNHFSHKLTIFHGLQSPAEGDIVGYAAIIDKLKLSVPLPYKLILINQKNREEEEGRWIVLGPRYEPKDTLIGHLTISIKYQGIDLLFYKKLFDNIEPEYIESWVKESPQSRFAHKIWFLYEWLTGLRLDLPDISTGNYDFLLDPPTQYGRPNYERSPRHRIYNNLPGTQGFCPLVTRTKTIDEFIQAEFNQKVSISLQRLPLDLIQRTSAFLMLKDSKASFTIEKESPPQSRAMRWGRAIGEAGQNPLTHDELHRLQQMIIEDRRFIHMGYRTEGGFVGEHDRDTGSPIPDHISARHQDIRSLMDGLLATDEVLSVPRGLENSGYHPVLMAAAMAFGFVFIHPFVDGNGRIHRYIIHHVLANKRFTPRQIIFPVSAAILKHLDKYREILEAWSHPLLDFIQWKETADHNVEVTNDTSDYYRYFDATPFVEFLFECIKETIDHIIPEEIRYLEQYDQFRAWCNAEFDIPDLKIELLIRMLKQNKGKLSLRAREKEFALLTPQETEALETAYAEIFEA